jgi:hypothetical protein
MAHRCKLLAAQSHARAARAREGFPWRGELVVVGRAGESSDRICLELITSHIAPQVVYMEGAYHMYAARMANHCGLNSWWCNSEVVHAESDTPDGLFRTEGTVVLPFAHNPAVGVAKDGTIVVYHIGAGKTPTGKQGNCTNGTSGLDTNGTKAWCGSTVFLEDQEGAPSAPGIGEKWNTPNIAYSTSGPRGPWQQLQGNSSWGADNPAPVFLDNSSVLLYAKFKCNDTINPNSAGACYQYGLLRADDWRGPWAFVRMIEVFGEDVVAWQDQRGHFHMILQGGPYAHTTSAYLKGCEGHYHLAHSRDGLDWTMHCHAALATNFNYPLTDGTALKVARRERQFVLLSREKQPLWWYNGVAGQDYNKNAGLDHTYSGAQPFHTESPQLHEAAPGGTRTRGRSPAVKLAWR